MKDIHSLMKKSFSKQNLSSSLVIVDNKFERNKKMKKEMDNMKSTLINDINKEVRVNKPIAHIANIHNLSEFMKNSPIDKMKDYNFLVTNGKKKKKIKNTLFNKSKTFSKSPLFSFNKPFFIPKKNSLRQPFFFENEIELYKSGFRASCS